MKKLLLEATNQFMKTAILNPSLKCFAVLLLLLAFNPQLSILAQGTAFTYQGRLSEGLSPVNGSYDFTFEIFDVPVGGNSLAGPVSTNGLIVSDGLLTVTLDFGAGPFSGGAPRWLQISVRTNGDGAFGILTPRQALTATPYAITAGNLVGTVAAGQIGGTLAVAQLPTTVLTNNQSGVNLIGSFAGDGSSLSNLNVSAVGVSNVWRLNGNAGTSPGTNFLGTTDNQPLEFRVNGQRALRLEPNAQGAPNFIGGASVNFVAAGKMGATIGGGGATNFGFQVYSNSVSSDFGTIGGGTGNTIDVNGLYATIGGGQNNTVEASSRSITIAGGSGNTVGFGSFDGTIGGGTVNTIGHSSHRGTIGGGDGNTISPNSFGATIPGGVQNTATNNAFAAGTRAQAVHDGAFVWADYQLQDFSSSGPNQFLIRAAGNVGINKNNPSTALDVNGTVTALGFSIAGRLISGPTSSSNLLNLLVGGGSLSTASNGSLNGISFYEIPTVKAMSLGYDGSGGSSANALRIYGSADLPLVTFQNGGNVGIGTTTPATALHVKDSLDAEISVESSQAGAHRWTLQSTRVSGNSVTDASFQILDRTLGVSRLVIGTNGNLGIGTSSPTTLLHLRDTGDTEISLQSTDLGAHRWTLQSSGVSSNNLVTDASFQILDRTLNESRLFIGRDGNVGIRNTGPATALHVKDSPDAEISIESLQPGAHRWSLQSSRVSPTTDSASFQIIDRTRGARCLTIQTDGFTAIDGDLSVIGTIRSGSDRNSKTNFAPVDAETILNRVLGLPIQQWRFRTEKEGIKHIGPMAQDFRAAFGLGIGDTSIATVDADGVALAAIQGLNQKVEERTKKLEAELKSRDTEIAGLKQRLDALEKLIRDRIFSAQEGSTALSR